MSAHHEHARISIRWDPSADEELVLVLGRLVSELPRRFVCLEVVAAPKGGRAELILHDSTFTLARAALGVVRAVREEIYQGRGMDVWLSVERVGGAHDPDPIVVTGAPGDVHVGRSLAEWLPDETWQELFERGGSLFYPAGSHDPVPHRLPHRQVREGVEPLDVRWLRDGLFDPSSLREALPLDALWRQTGPHVIVVGAPWLGKSHCAKALFRDQQARVGPDKVFFIDAAASESLHWTGDSRGERYVVVDGADEAYFRGVDLGDLLQPLRERTRVIVFTRDDPSLAVIRRELPTAATFQLLPIDEVEAVRDLGGERFERARRRALDAGLRGPWSIPQLRALAREDWEAPRASEILLLARCTEGVGRTDRGVSDDDLLHVAGRLASVSLLSGVASFSTENDDPITTLIAWNRRRALEVLGRSSLFVATRDGLGFRSAHDRELLTARALRDVVDPAVARSLLTDETGCLRPDLGEVVKELRRDGRVRWLGEIDRWERATPPALPEEEALAVLEGLLEHPTSPLFVLPGARHLTRIDVAAVRDRSLSELTDRERPVARRQRCLELAELLDWPEVPRLALRLALSSDDDAGLRADAVRLVAEEQVPQLLELVDGVPSNEATGKLREVAILRLVGAGILGALPAAATLESLPRGSGLRGVIARALTDAEVAELLGRMSARLAAASPQLAPGVLDELFDAIDDRIAEIPWDPDVAGDVATLVGRLRIRDIRFRPADPNGAVKRRLFYEAMLGSRLQYMARNMLTAEDVDWLLELASASAPLHERLATDLAHRLWSLDEADPRRAAAESVLRERAPGVWSHYEPIHGDRPPEWHAERERWARQAAERRAAEEAALRPLSEVIEEALGLDPAARLRGLSELCFVEDAPSFSDVSGRFESLSVERRRAIVDETRRLVQRVDPSIVPEAGASFSSNVLADAAAFCAAVLWDDEDGWLTDAVVRAWLPLVLFDARFQRSGPARAVVARCSRAAPDAAIQCVTAALEREVRDGSVSVARTVPNSMWTRLVRAVRQLLGDPTVSAAGRRDLVMEALREPVLDRELSSALRGLVKSDEALRVTAIAALVVLRPEEGLPLVPEVATDVETLAATLDRLVDLGRWTPGKRAELLRGVSTASLLAVARSLYQLVPLESPYRRRSWGTLTSRHQLYDLRGEVLTVLATRADFDVEKLAEVLSDEKQADELRASVAWRRDREEAARLLDSLRPGVPAWDPEELLQVLGGGRRARFSSELDLLYAMASGLRDRRDETLDYVQLLRGTDTRGGALRDWPHEHSLQAYVHLRMREILRIAGKVYREVQERAGRDRPDLIGVAVGRDGDDARVLELPVEVKWSHNPDWLTALEGQLGQRYMLDQRRPCGLYVVGFTAGGRSRQQKDIARLTAALLEEKARFEHVHEGTSIEVVVLPCAPIGASN